MSSGIRTPGVERHPGSRAATAGRGRARPLAAPEAARGLRRPGARQGAARDLHRGRPGPRRGARPRAAGRPARTRQDSLAQIVANELGAGFVPTAGPALERKGDVASYLTALEPRSVFFVDEIHRLPRALEETFYPAMEDRKLPITVGQGAGARVVTLDLPDFTLIGATTRAGLLTTPLRDRFGVTHRLELYEPAGPRPRSSSARRASSSVEIDDRGRRGDRPPLARHPARGQPAAQARARLRRGARRRPDRRGRGRARRSTCSRWTPPGLDRLDREILRAICAKFGGGPVGLSHPCRRRGRGAGHDRGRLRALSAPAGLHHAHARGAASPPTPRIAHLGSSGPRGGAQRLF